MSLLSLLSYHIRTHGPIKTARVSVAKCTRWSYRDAVRYQIRIGTRGMPVNVALERATTSRRSERLVESDCDDLCEREGRARLQKIGAVSEYDAGILMGDLAPAAVAVHDSRRSTSPRPLMLAERLLLRRVLRLTDRTAARAAQGIRDRKIVMCGRWIAERGPIAYVPHGDHRDSAAFAAESNQQHRRRMIYAACGERVLAVETMRLVQRDDYGALYDPGLGDGYRVRVVCPSTGAVYMLPVSRYCRTAREAVAETFGLTGAEYAPAAQA